MTLKRIYLLLVVLLLSFSLLGCTEQRTLILPLNSNYDTTTNVKLNTTIVSNTTTETEVYSGLITSNEIKAGQILKVISYGVVSTASASDSVTIRFKINNVTKQTFIMTPKVVTNEDFHLVGTATQRILGVTGSRASHQDICIGDECNSQTSVGVFDTTMDHTLSITAQ